MANVVRSKPNPLQPYSIPYYTTTPIGDTMKQPSNPTPKVTVLKEGAVSEYTACRECGKRFTQKNPTARFRALAKHYYSCTG